MKLFKHEENILTIIKYGPIIFVLIISFFFTQQFISQQQKLQAKEIKSIENKYLEENKFRVKEEIERIQKYITEEKNNSTLHLKNELQNRVENAYQIATNLHKQYKNTKTKEEIIDLIKESLRPIRFNNNRGYYYILTMDAVNVLHSFQPNLEGKDLYNIQDVKGNYFNQTTIDLMNKKGDGFVNYFWHKPGDLKKMYKKITFNKRFKPYNLYIGTGEYINDHEENLKVNILNHIQKIRYGNNGYIFVYNDKGNCLSHYKKEYIGKNRINVQDKHGRFILQDILNFTKTEGSGYISYISSIKTSPEIKSNDKISYVSLFKPWNWSIGTGFYLDHLNQLINQKKKILDQNNDEAFLNILKISAVITLLFVLISFYLSKILSNMFLEYKENIQNEIKNTLEKEKLLIQQSKMATMGEMLGSIAHQWKQPLSVISMSNGLLRFNKEDKDFLDDESHNESLDNIDTSVNNLSQTIDDFRNFFNPNKARVLFKVSDAFNETINLISSQLQNNDIELVQNISDIEFYGSQNELQQTLINLLKNAKEELVKKAHGEKRYIFITTQKDDNFVYIKIKDNANGIDSTIINKVFDAYFTTKEADGGTGIGLYMSKQIVEMSLKGKITVSNKEYIYKDTPYIGAEFIITIPIDLRSKRRGRLQNEKKT